MSIRLNRIAVHREYQNIAGYLTTGAPILSCVLVSKSLASWRSCNCSSGGPALGANWLSSRLGEFVELFPEVKLQLLLSDDELDIGMREADVALRLREPIQPDLIRRRLFTVHFHAYASADYLKKSGQPRTLSDLDDHRLVAFGAPTATHFLYDLNSLLTVGRDSKSPRAPHITINNLAAIIRAVEHGVGIAVLPDYCVAPNSGLVRLLPQADMPEMDCFLVYAEEMKNVARVQAFRDFLVSKAQRWQF